MLPKFQLKRKGAAKAEPILRSCTAVRPIEQRPHPMSGRWEVTFAIVS